MLSPMEAINLICLEIVTNLDIHIVTNLDIHNLFSSYIILEALP